MKVSELEGAALDAAVAKAEGIAGLVEKDGRMCHEVEWDPETSSWRDDLKAFKMWVDYAPSARWEHGGLIIEREHIGFIYLRNQGHWVAQGDGERLDRPRSMRGPTPLIAAMRAFVASRLGDEIN